MATTDSIASNAQQLTIFYGGMVVVLDGFTPEKAAELIRLAGAAAGQEAPPKPTTLVDMPIARNESLRRFLAKRNERAAAAAPVPDSEPTAKKGKVLEVNRRREEAASWLALGLGSMHAPSSGPQPGTSTTRSPPPSDIPIRGRY